MIVKKVTKISRSGLKKGFTKETYENTLKNANSLVIEANSVKPFNKVKINKAIDLYNQAINIDSSKAEPYIAIAYIAKSFGDLESSVALLKTVKKQIPLDTKADLLLKEIEKDYKKGNLSQNNGVSLSQNKKIKQILKSNIGSATRNTKK